MAFTDPLQWIIITVFIVGILGFVIYFILRVFRTLNRVDKYLDDEERNPGNSPRRESL